MTTWIFIQNIFLALGGLGLFLLGLKTMSDSLKNVAGSRMRAIIGRATANRFLGFLFGMVVTAVTQSSTATSVMAIGFVNAGLMNLSQFASIIIGAGVGTTFTAFLFNFRIDPIAPLLIFVGMTLNLFFSKKLIKNIGMIVLGIGTLFFGLSIMGAPLREFSELDGFQRLLVAFENPFLALLAGLLFTAIIQSSTASIGIIIAMYLGGVDLYFGTAAFLVLGANIGTCSTALLSSLAADRKSKRAALIHVSYKFIAGGASAIIIVLFPGILLWFQETWQYGNEQVAAFHLAYNLAASGIMIFFTNQLVRLVYFIIPKQSADDNLRQLEYLEESKDCTPEVIFTQAHGEIRRMGKMVRKNLRLALEAFFEKDSEKADQVLEIEKTINYLRSEISSYLMSVTGSELTAADVEILASLLHTVSDLERLGDHAENIAEYIVSEKSYRKYLPNEAVDELYEISQAMMGTLTLALEIFETHDNSRLPQAEELEQKVDDLCELYLSGHMARLKKGEIDPRSGVVFSSVMSDLERCSDHALNVAQRTYVGIQSG